MKIGSPFIRLELVVTMSWAQEEVHDDFEKNDWELVLLSVIVLWSLKHEHEECVLTLLSPRLPEADWRGEREREEADPGQEIQAWEREWRTAIWGKTFSCQNPSDNATTDGKGWLEEERPVCLLSVTLVLLGKTWIVASQEQPLLKKRTHLVLRYILWYTKLCRPYHGKKGKTHI